MNSHITQAVEYARSVGFLVTEPEEDDCSFRVYSKDKTKWATVTVGHSGLVRWNTPGTEFRQFDTQGTAFKELKKAWGRSGYDFGNDAKGFGNGLFCSYTGAASTGSGTCICMVCSRLRGGY